MGEILPQENNVRTSTYRISDSYDPARNSIRFISYQTLLSLALMVLSLTSWGQEFTGTGNWSNPANWSTGAVPGAGTDVTISGNCTMDVSPTTVANININPGATLDARSNTLFVRGNWTNNGAFTASTSTVVFLGTAVPNLTLNGTTTFYNLLVTDDKIHVDISSGASVTVLNNNDISPSGNLTNNGSFIAGSGVIDIAGSFTNNLSSLFTCNNTTLKIARNFTLAGGTFNANTATIEVGEAFADGSAATFNSGTSIVRFVGASAGVSVSADEPFYNVEVRKAGGSIAIGSNLVVRNLDILSTLPTVVPPAIPASVLFSTPGVTMDVQGTLRVTTGTIDLSASDNTYLKVSGSTIVNGGRIFVYRLAATSALILNGGLTLSAGSVEIGPGSGAPALSKFIVTGTTNISGTGRLITNTTASVDLLGNVLLAGGVFNAYNSKIEVTGDWQSNNTAYFGASTSTVRCTGNTNTTIQGLCRFANLTVEKSEGALVTNTSNLRIEQNLLAQSGTFILTESGGTDMDLLGDLTIINGASMDMSGANILIQIGGNLEDRNTAEPRNTTPRRGLYIGMNQDDPMGKRQCTPGAYTIWPIQTLPTIRFNGNSEQRITGYVPLRTYCGGFYPKEGIALPNIEINKTDFLRLNSDVNLRIHGNLIINRGGFDLSSQILYFGDHENDEISINTNGVFIAPERSQIIMNTGTTANGTFLKVNGGALKLLGSANNPVVITREGTVGQYYRMAAFSGTVEAIYTTISYQGSSNAGFPNDPSLPADATTYQSAGGFKIYSPAVIDPSNLGYNFSYCVLGANAAGGTTSLTINTGQTLNIRGTIFNTSGSGGINLAKNNAAGVITFFRSSGELGGVNGEFYDGGSYADANSGTQEGIIWETFDRIYWVGNTYDPGRVDGTETRWSDFRNWSTSRSGWENGSEVYPGLYPAPASMGPADACQQFEVFIAASARTSPVLDGNYTIQGTLINNAKGRNNLFDLSPEIPANYGKTLNLNGFILTVWGDLVNNNRDANGNTLNSGNAIIRANPGGTIRFRANFASFHPNTTLQVGSGFVLEAFDNSPLQEIKIAGNDLQEFTINKPEGRVVVQGFGTDRLDVRRNLNIISGGLEMLTDTPILVDGNFNISGGFFTFNSSIAIVRGNWNNTGGTINTGGGIVYFYPYDNSPKFVRSGGQSFNQVNFGMINNTTGALATPASPASPEATRYRIVDHFTATNLVTIAARGEISRNTTPYSYNDSPAVTAANPAQARIVEVEANVTVRANGMRVRENGELILREGATLLISNNNEDYATDDKNYNPFPPSLSPLGLRVEGETSAFPVNGKLTAIGTANNYVKISRNGISGVYNFKVNGTLSNRYYLFEFMDANGVDLTAATSTTISPGTATIPNNGAAGTQTVNVASFSDGILTNGTIGGVYIRYSYNEAIFGAAPDTIYNVNFPVPLLDGQGNGANIRRTAATCASVAGGIVWFRNATGAFAGEAFDDDGPVCGLDQIQWRQPQIRRWDGEAGTNYWHNAANWRPDGVPLPDEDVVLDHTYVSDNYTVIINSSTGDVAVNNLSIINNSDPTQITLQVTESRSLQVNKGFTIDVPTGTTLGKLILNNGTSMEVGENWSNKGSFESNTAPVTFGAGYNGSRVIFNAKPTNPVFNINPASPINPAFVGPEPTNYIDNTFHRIIFKSGRTELNSDLLVKENLMINRDAKLDNSSSSDPSSILKGPNGIHPNTILIEGDWINDNGTFLPTDGTVNFVGLNQQTLIKTHDNPEFAVENFYTLKIEKLFPNPSPPYDRDVEVRSKATVANELNLQRGRFLTRQNRELILLTDNIIRNSSAANTTAFVQGPLGQLYRGIGEIKHKFAVGDKLWPGDFAYLTIKLSSTSTDRGTVFIMEQKDTDPDPSFNPLYPNDPAPYGTDRLLPEPLNFLSRSRFWNVKNIMFPVTKPTPGLNAELVSGKIELPLAVQDEDASVTTSNGWITTPNQTLAEVLNELQELSIVQDTANTTLNPLYAPAALPTQVDRGWAEQGQRWGDLGGELNVRESGGAIKATYISNPFYKLGNGDFAFAWNYIPLPVEFLNLQASRKGEAVMVKWTTASEKNITHYVVERSSNGKEFTTVGMADAKENSTLLNNYSLTDLSPLPTTSYYRVYSVDIFGTAQYSKIVAVNSSDELNRNSTDALLVFPNPFDGRSINFSLTRNEGTLQVMIYDMLGKQVYADKKQNYTYELVNVQIDMPLTPGIYMLHILSEKGVYKKKIIVK